MKKKKVFKNELLDLIIPYLIGYPHIQNIPFHEGPYEKDNVCLKKGDIVLDCGANIGMFSAYASLKECSVFAFEPTEETYNKYLSKTIALNPGIHYIPKALYTKDGVQEFFLDKDNIGCNGMNISLKNIKSHSSEKIKVETTSIDSFVQENNLSKVDFIKADIEGSERFMLAGAKETLRRFQPNLSICYYHLLDDYKVLCNLIKSANSDYEIESDYKKIYAYVKK